RWLYSCLLLFFFFFFQAEDGIRDRNVTGVQTCALPILRRDRVLVGPGAVDPGSGGRPGRRHADRVGRFARQTNDVAVMIEVGGVVEQNADDERALAERVVHRALECRHGARALALVALAASADV